MLAEVAVATAWAPDHLTREFPELEHISVEFYSNLLYGLLFANFLQLPRVPYHVKAVTLVVFGFAASLWFIADGRVMTFDVALPLHFCFSRQAGGNRPSPVAHQKAQSAILHAGIGASSPTYTVVVVCGDAAPAMVTWLGSLSS